MKYLSNSQIHRNIKQDDSSSAWSKGQKTIPTQLEKA